MIITNKTSAITLQDSPAHTMHNLHELSKFKQGMLKMTGKQVLQVQPGSEGINIKHMEPFNEPIVVPEVVLPEKKQLPTGAGWLDALLLAYQNEIPTWSAETKVNVIAFLDRYETLTNEEEKRAAIAQLFGENDLNELFVRDLMTVIPFLHEILLTN